VPPASQSDSGSRAEQSIQAFRDALEKSVTLSRERLQEVVDDAVRRGRMTRGDAEELVGRMVTRSRDQLDDILKQLEELTTQLRGAGSAAASAATNPQRTAERAAEKAKQGIEDARGRARSTADRARRKAGLTDFPISGYDDLKVADIDSRLSGLKPAELRKVRDYEKRNKARKGVLRAIDRRLSS
jgi:polyhydroxyalkanoate synthesis regulator phasin